MNTKSKIKYLQVHNVQNKKTHKKLLELNWKQKIFYLFQMKNSFSSLNKKSQSCLGILALHFVATFIHNVNNFERTQQHCSVQNENLGWMLTNVHPKNQNLEI